MGFAIALLLLSMNSVSEAIAWNTEQLFQAPKAMPAPDFSTGPEVSANPETAFTGEGVTPVFFDGLPWQGKPTRVFACYGFPKDASGPCPGMVLVHGGGGTVFDEWVRIWNRRGYAAIAVDLTGTHPGGKPGERPRHEWGGPDNYGDRRDIDWPLEDQWVYHAVADVVLANSLLRSFPEVDPNRIGVTGISWGGFLTCIVAAVDTRFRCAIPVYGCGFLDASPAWKPLWDRLGPEKTARWIQSSDPSVYLQRVQMPMLWVNGANDRHFPMNIHTRSSMLAQGPVTRSIRVGLQHSHVHGWLPEEIYVYADSILKAGAGLDRIVDQGCEGRSAWVAFEATAALAGAELVYAADVSDWVGAQWKAQAIPIPAGQPRISVELPPDCRAYFVNLTDNRGLVTSSAMRECDAVP